MKLHLLVIDPQTSFCHPTKGSLYVQGAEKDMDRLALMVRRLKGKLDDIHVTLDSHRRVDIAHPLWFVDKSSGKHPDPLTLMTLSGKPSKGATRDGQVVDVPGDTIVGKNLITNAEREYTTTKQALLPYTRYYLHALTSKGRYPHVVWPEHCIIGDEGHNVWPALSDAIHNWEECFAAADYVTKGSNMYTEHFSGVQAEVPDPTDPTTLVNSELIRTLEDADVIALAGEALSHCMANTVRDIVANFSDPRYVQKLVLLTDATSNVTGFEKFGTDFIAEMTAKGMRLDTTTTFLA